jgi:hypothetical protein
MDNFFNLTNTTFLSIMGRFIINIVSLFILLKLVYYKFSGKEKYLFSFFLIGILTFFVTSVLTSVFIEMAGAFGLFAVLGILRMRTSSFSIKDMAYTFATLGISVINALNVLKFPLLGVIVIDAIIISSAYILELFLLRHKSDTYSIVYENIELLRPEKKQKLLKDVSELTGKSITKIKIRKIDYKKQEALLDISCRDCSE